MWCTTETGQRRSILGIGRLFPSQPFAVPPAERKRGNTKMILRQELPRDYETVHHLIADSFATAEHSDGNEADLVAALRTFLCSRLVPCRRGSGRDRRPYFIDKSPCGQHHGACPGPAVRQTPIPAAGHWKGPHPGRACRRQAPGLFVCTGPGKPGLLYKVRIRPSGAVSHRSPQGGPFRPSHGNLLVGKPRSHSRNPDLRERI